MILYHKKELYSVVLRDIKKSRLFTFGLIGDCWKLMVFKDLGFPELEIIEIIKQCSYVRQRLHLEIDLNDIMYHC